MSHDFLSGDAGDVTHPWRRLKRGLGELGYDALDRAALTGRRMDRLAAAQAPRRVLVVGVYRPGSLLPAALRALTSERHSVRLAFGAVGEPEPELAEHTLLSGLEGGKFENLNRLLEGAGASATGRSPSTTTCACRRASSTASWRSASASRSTWPSPPRRCARTRPGRRPVAGRCRWCARRASWRSARSRPSARRAAAELLPFPELRFGWGLDLHWSALAAERGWRLGVVDALPVRHEARLVAADYARDDAIAEAAGFLADRPYLPSARAGDTLAVHRRA